MDDMRCCVALATHSCTCVQFFGSQADAAYDMSGNQMGSSFRHIAGIFIWPASSFFSITMYCPVIKPLGNKEALGSVYMQHISSISSLSDGRVGRP